MKNERSHLHRSPLHRMDARTRAIGLAGIAEARATLAACRAPVDDPSDDEAVDSPRSDRSQARLPLGVDRHLPEAA